MSPELSRFNWIEANQRYLTAELSRVRRHLENYAARTASGSSTPINKQDAVSPDTVEAWSLPSASALDTLCGAFHLSAFERDTLLMCAGVELDSSFATLIASIEQGARTGPTFSLALAALPEPHWSALTPVAPLRRFRIIEPAQGQPLTAAPLRIDERILHYLTGISYLDERINGLIEIVQAQNPVPASHEDIVRRITTLCAKTEGRLPLPVIGLIGADVDAQKEIAWQACRALGLNLCLLQTQNLPPTASERDALIRLWEREAFLTRSALLLDCHKSDPADRLQNNSLSHFISASGGMILTAAPDRKHFSGRRQSVFEIGPTPVLEQQDLWLAALGNNAEKLNGRLDQLTGQFQLSPRGISAACEEAKNAAKEMFETALWDACRKQARPRLEELAQRIEPKASWEDLVVPPLQKETLKAVAANVRLRHRVYDAWGFADKSARGLGISALFSGPSGTGKTLAAEVLADELKLDLFRIDLSQVVNKYIGETEKNLKRVFDAAEAGGAILLFDEADALFGKRSEVKDSHDRYANIEVSYLLQRMETYRGLAILTTNMKEALDTAFLRRIRFVVQFPFPDASQRAEIWRKIFPAQTPTGPLDAQRLSSLQIAGGNIRNIALGAAFLAADANRPVEMPDILQAAKREYAKLEKQMNAAETAAFTE